MPGHVRLAHLFSPVTKHLTLSGPEVGLARLVDCVWNVMAHAQKPDFVFRRNGRVHLNRRWGVSAVYYRQASRNTSACGVCTARASLCSAVTWPLLATHSILLFPLHFSSRASPCAITFQLNCTDEYGSCGEWLCAERYMECSLHVHDYLKRIDSYGYQKQFST
jgi:hypothetical protein